MSGADISSDDSAVLVNTSAVNRIQKNIIIIIIIIIINTNP